MTDRTLLLFLLVPVVAYVAWGVFVFAMQRSMMFPGASMPAAVADETDPPRGVESVRIPFSGGTAEAWFLPARGSSPSPAIIFAHGNAEFIDHGLADARALAALGASVLLVEYPGYGRSDGEPSRASISEVFLGAYDGLTARPDVDRQRIAGFGRSLGAGVIGDLSRQRPLRTLVFQSPFTSVAHFARRFLLPGFLVRDGFDNVAALRQFDGPVLLLHGEHDAIIPIAHSERLAEIAPDAELVRLACGHNDCPPDRHEFMRLLADFLERSGVVPSNPASH